MACNATFADFDHSEVQRGDFTTCSDYVFGAEYHWVCDRCFADLKGSIGWTAVEDPACESKR
ncbi:MAG: hypothetical protein KY449_06865 [Proteobacteria bacterium]|nr:hypothetical protein [Pseudomonadota bacterium]